MLGHHKRNISSLISKGLYLMRKQTYKVTVGLFCDLWKDVQGAVGI